MGNSPQDFLSLFSALGDFILHNDNRFIIAAIDMLFVPGVLILFGLLIGLVNDTLTGILSRFLGSHAAFLIRNYLTYPGTVHHELSHALLATLTGARVKNITLIPKGRELGSASFYPTGNTFTKSLQLTLSSIAPVICGSISLFLLGCYVLPLCNAPWQTILLGYFMICILLHMNLSTKDIQVAKRGLPICMAILYLIFFIWNINLPYQVSRILLSVHIPKLF